MSDSPPRKTSSTFSPIAAAATFNIITAPNLPLNSISKLNTNHIEQKVLEEANNEEIDIDAEIENTDHAQDYFKEDPEKEPEEDENAMRRRYQNGKLTNLYESYFKPGVFFKFLLMHALFFGLMGPAIVILTPIFGWKTLYNQGFVGLTISNAKQTLEFAIIISFLVFYYVMDIHGMDAIEVYMMFIAILIRIITIASKYSYQPLCYLKLFSNTILTRADLTYDNLLGRWRLQTDDIVEEEIQSAVMRLEVDSPLFFFNFLGETSADLKNRLSKTTKLSRVPTFFRKPPPEAEEPYPCLKEDTTRKGNRPNTLTLPRTPVEPGSEQSSFAADTPKERALSGGDRSMTKSMSKSFSSRPLLPTNTSAVFRAFSHFFDYKQLEGKFLYGYNLAFDLIKTSKNMRYANIGKKTLLLSIVRALIPTFYRLYLIGYKKEDISVVTDRPYIIVIIFLLNTFLFWANTFILIMSVQDFKAKIWTFKQIGYMISPKKIHYFKERKLFPTLNIFDPITLKTWSNLRKIMKEYGKKYFLRNNLNICIAMTFYFFVFATLILQAFGVFKVYGDPLMFFIFGFETVVYFALMLNVMKGAAFLNSQYGVHKNLLKKNKTIISDFQRLSYLYVGKEAIKPDNIIYKEGLKVLRDELGEENFQEKLVERAALLTGMIDDIIEELEFEEVNEPFTVMGIAIDYNMMKSVMLGGVSLAFALAQSLIN